jgi:hypothetical protein
MAFDFTAEHWETLRDALLDHACTAEVVGVRQKKHGVAYALRGVLTTPDERNPVVLSVWQIDNGRTSPHFITAYPYSDKE